MGRLILLVLQLVIGWFAGLAIVKMTTFGGNLKLAVFAVVFAALAWIVGLVAAELLQGVNRPAPRALVSALIGAGIGVALLFIPQVQPYLQGFNDLYLPLIGAVLGYHVRA
mgnify:CR=1 FL=1